MRRFLDLPLIVILMGIGSAAMLLPAAHALALGDEGVARVFAQSGSVFLVVAAMVGIAASSVRPRNPARSQLASLAGAYLALPVMLAVPVAQAVPDTSFFNAWFEMVSCLTTTGATVYDAPDRLTPSVHLWRVLTGWLGGFLVLVGAGALLAPLDLGGAEVLTGRVPGRGGGEAAVRRSDPGMRLARHAVTLFPAYAGLTLLLWVLLLIEGMDGFAALAFAMSTLSSSGITPGAGLPAFGAGVTGEMLIFAFLCIGLTRRSLPTLSLVNRSHRIIDDPELRTAAVLLAAVPLLLILRQVVATIGAEVVPDLPGALRAVWAMLFMALSFLTTTGFEAGGWVEARAWAALSTPGLILVGLAMVGGGIATTTGGLKLLRVYALVRHGERELGRIVYPSSIGGGGQSDRRLQSDGAYAAWIFLMLYSLTLALVIGLLALSNVGLDDALILAVAAISTTGPLATLAAEAPIRYADLDPAVKVVLSGAMILGRLEVLAVLALLAPSAWRQ